MSSDVSWSTVDVLFQGLNEHIDPRVLPPGLLVEVTNGEYRRPGGIRKRWGLDRVAVGSSGGVPAASALVRHNRELLLLDGTGSNTIPPSLWTLNEGAERWRRHVEMPSAAVRIEPVATDLSSEIRADEAYAGGYLVQALVLVSTGRVIVRIRRAETMALVVESDVGTGIISPRCAAVSDRYVAVTWIETGGLINGAYVDCAAPTPTITSAGTIVSDASTSTTYHDMIGNQGEGGFALVYRQTGTPQVVRVLLLSNALAITFSTTFGTYPSGMSLLETTASPRRIVVNWLNDDNGDPPVKAWQYAVRSASNLSSVLAPTTWFAAAGVSRFASGISLRADGSSVLLLRSELGAATPNQVSSLAWRTATLAGVLGSTNEKRNCWIAGKPWRTGPLHSVWVVAGGDIDETAGTYALIDLEETSDRAFLVSSVSRGLVGSMIIGTGHVPFSTPLDTTNSVRRGCAPTEYVALESRFGPRELVVSYTDLGRFKAVEFGGCTYMAGGCITQWDGARIHEVGFAVPPEITLSVAAGAGTWAATGTYSYAVVYEVVDSQRNRHRSAPSAIKIATVVATTDVVTLKIEPLTITRRYWNGNTVERTPRVIATIFRSNAPGSNVLQRLRRFDSASLLLSDPESLASLTFTDTGAAAESPAEILYTTSNEAENDPVEGGGTTITVHRDRLWVGGGGDPEVIWYSKPRVDDRPAEFSLEQQLRIPGQRVIVLESMDDVLVAFCERGIYAVDGEGPTATGLDGVFGTPRLLDRNVGCLSPTSIVVGPPGIFFHSDRGIELLNRGRVVEYIGAPIESTLALYPHVLSALVVPEKGQVRFSLSNTARTEGRLAVYDYVEQRWAIWAYTVATGLPWVGVSTWIPKSWELGTQRNVVYLGKNGDLYEEAPAAWSDFGEVYLMAIETGWLSFGSFNGYLRVRKVHPLIQKLGSHALDVTMRFRYDETATATKSFTGAQITALGTPEQLRVYVPQPKQTSPAIKVRFAEALYETEPTFFAQTEAFAAQGVAFEIGRIPGLRRLPAAATK